MTPRPDTGQATEFIEAVFTCKGDFYDPNFPRELELFNRKLHTLLNADNDHLIIKKVEPWNSVKVTVNIPKEAAARLKLLASQNNGAALRNMGIISLQMEGDRIISLTLSNSSALSVSHSSSAHEATHSRPSTSAAASNDGATVNNSTSHNLLHLPNNPSSSPLFSETPGKGPMLPPPDVVPPITIPKPKSEKRQRRPPAVRAPGNKSKAGKSKSAQASGSSSTSNNDILSPSPVMGALPSDCNRVSMVAATSTITTATGSTLTATSTVDLPIIHPALKDIGLTSISKSSSLSTDLTEKEKVSSLLTSLINRSPDKTFPAVKSSASSLTLPNKSSLLQNTPLLNSNSWETTDNSITVTTAPSNQLHHVSSEHSGSIPVLTSATSSMCTSAVPATSSASSPPRSEHVSVIAKLSVHGKPPEVQTEAMDLSESAPVRAGKRDDCSDLPMDLSTSTTATTSVPSNADVGSLDNESTRMEESLPHHTPTPPPEPDKLLATSMESAPDLEINTNSDINTVTKNVSMETNALDANTQNSPSSSKALAVIENEMDEEMISNPSSVDQPTVIKSSHTQQVCSSSGYSDDLHSIMTTADSALPDPPGDCESDHTSIVNGLEAENDTVNLSKEDDIVHGEPVSVICLANEDVGRSSIPEELDTAISVEEPQLPPSVTIEKAHLQSSLSSVTTLLNDAVKRNSHEELLVSNESSTYHVTDPGLTGDIIGYNEHTPRYITTAEHEPAENGSSTSTDSGVVAGSPKSDICATPPADEEHHLDKTELLNAHSTNRVLDQPPPTFAEEVGAATVEKRVTTVETIITTAEIAVTPVEPIANAVNTTHTTPVVIGTYDTMSIPPSANRPCVSILKTVRPIPTNNIKESNYVRVEKPVTTKVLESELRLSSSSQILKMQQSQRTQPANTISYLMNSQGNMSNVLLAAANAASANQPYLTVPSLREHSLVQIPTAPVSTTSVAGVMNVAQSNSKPRVSTLLLTNRNDKLVLVDSRHSIEQPLRSTVKNHQGEKGTKPGYVISTRDSNTFTSNHSNIGSSTNKYHIVSQSTESKLPQTVMNISETKQSGSRNLTIASTPVPIVASINPPKHVTSTVNQRILMSVGRPAIHPVHQIVNTQPSTLSSNSRSQFEFSSRVAHNLPVSLPGVRVINKPTISTENTTASADHSVIQSNAHQVDTTKLAMPNTKEPLAEDVKIFTDSQSDSNDHCRPVTDSDSNGSNHIAGSNSQTLSTLYAFESTEVSNVMVNGTSDDASSTCHDSESVTQVSNAGSTSPLSVTSSCAGLEVHTITSEGTAPSLPLYSPGQQRKSGRVRTIKSPDPDYVTPSTKVRKRGPRQISEDLNCADAAPSAKKPTKPITNKIGCSEPPTSVVTMDSVSDLLPVPTQINGPTSQAKRSTRSSGIADLQALPTVYRERKRSKR